MTYAGLVTKLSTSGSAEIFVKMKMYAVILVACLAIYVAAQEGEVGQPPIPQVTCLQGSSTNGVGNFSSVPCNLGSNAYSCETRIEINGENKYIERKCKQALACSNNQNNNAADCNSQEAISKKVRVCYFCCNQSNCNNFDNLPESTVAPATSTEEETIL